jgi:hypothetical protein
MQTSALPAGGDAGALNDAVIYLLVLVMWPAQPLNSAPARTREHNPKNLTVSLVLFMFCLIIGWFYNPANRKEYFPFVIKAKAD